MLFGNPDKFAFLIEKVPEWNDGFVNGLLYVNVNGEIFPKELYTTTLSDVGSVFDYAFVNPPKDERLYALSDEELFAELRKMRYNAHFTDDEDADEDYRYDIEYYEIGDWGYHIFAVSGGENVRVLIGYWVDPRGDVLENSLKLVNSVEITLEEFTKMREEFSEYYEKEIRGKWLWQT